MTSGLLREDLDNVLRRVSPRPEALRGARIFLAGGTGFFGKWMLESFALLNRELSLGAHVTVLSRNPAAFLAAYPHFRQWPEIALVAGDIRQVTLPREHFDYVIHAATEVSAKQDREHPEETHSVIMEGTRRMLDFSAACGAGTMLFVSSGAVYGSQPPDLARMPEEFLDRPEFQEPQHVYGRGKLHAEQCCREYAASHCFRGVIARGFAFVGPYQPLETHLAVCNFIRDCLENRPIVVQGDGTPLRSYMYAADLAVWLWTILLQGESGRAYNVGSDQAVSIAELAAEVNRCCGGRNEVRILQPAQGDAPPQRYVPDIDRARRELRLELEYDLRRSLEQTIRWCRK